MVVLLPPSFNRDILLPFFDALNASREEPEVTIDFSPLIYSYPSAMLVAGSKIREWVHYRKSRNLASKGIGINHNCDAHSYLMHLGFFDFIHMPIGNGVGQARGSTRYLPITKVSIPRFDPHANTLNEWHETIKSKSRDLAGVLAGSYDDTEELRVYSYSIREIIRNVFEHSGADECFVCGQRWWDGRVEIAILDEGLGISNTLRNVYAIEDDLHALDLALMPGVSRTNGLSAELNIFDNSGFGLYVLSNLAASFGWFVIASGNGRIIGENNTERLRQPFSFSGTFFGMRLNHQPHNFRSVLADIITLGESESGETGSERRASGISRFIE